MLLEAYNHATNTGAAEPCLSLKMFMPEQIRSKRKLTEK